MKIKFKAMVCIVETNRSFCFDDFDIVRKNYFIYLKYAALLLLRQIPIRTRIIIQLEIFFHQRTLSGYF